MPSNEKPKKSYKSKSIITIVIEINIKDAENDLETVGKVLADAGIRNVDPARNAKIKSISAETLVKRDWIL